MKGAVRIVSTMEAALHFSSSEAQDVIMRTFIHSAQKTLKGEISESGPSGGTKTPNVVKARQNGVVPAYPFVQLDIISTSDTSGAITAETFNSKNQVVYDTHTKYMLQYIIYGGNATAIANTLRKSFKRELIRLEIFNESKGLIEQVFQVDSIPSTLSTVNYEVASFNLTFNINDRYLDSEIGSFDTITLNGEAQQINSDFKLPMVVETP